MADVWVFRVDHEESLKAAESAIVKCRWGRLGSVTGASKPALLDRFRSQYPNITEGAVNGYVSQVLRFCQDVRIGDPVVMLVSGTSSVQFGEIVGEYEYHEATDDLCHCRAVRWKNKCDRSQLSEAGVRKLGTAQSFFRTSLSPADIHCLETS